MIAVLKPGASPERTQHLIHWLEEQNLGVHVSKGSTRPCWASLATPRRWTWR